MVAPHEITTMDSLLEALDGRGASPEERRAFDDAVWASRGGEGAIVVTDLSGFTRLTKQHGILHFLAVFRRCQNASLVAIDRYAGTVLKKEADDLMVLFGEARSAITAALEMQRAMHALNASLDEDDRVHLCVGIEHGRLLRLTDDAFGDPVNVAYKLGEDVAKPGEILVGPAAFAKLHESRLDLSDCRVSDRRVARTGDVDLEHWVITLNA